MYIPPFNFYNQGGKNYRSVRQTFGFTVSEVSFTDSTPPIVVGFEFGAATPGFD